MKKLTLSLTLILSLTMVSSVWAKEAFLLVDILVLKEGKTLADAKAYFEKVEPIFKKYNMYRSDEVLDVMQVPRGTLQAQVINLWETTNPDAAFKGIFSDKEYEAFIPLREEVFDMPKATVVVTQRK